VLPGLFRGLSKQLSGQGEDELLKLIGESSLLHTDVVYKLGLLHPTEVAWRTDKCVAAAAVAAAVAVAVAVAARAGLDICFWGGWGLGGGRL